jgi:hypothetical protein
MQPPRVLWEIRQALGRRDILISDVGLHKLWIARMFPAHEPDTVFIANGLAGMGIALPTAIAAKLVHPDRNVVTVSADIFNLFNFHAVTARDQAFTEADVDPISEEQQKDSEFQALTNEEKLRQLQYEGASGEFDSADINPNFKNVTAYQSPRSVRFGIRVTF